MARKKVNKELTIEEQLQQERENGLSFIKDEVPHLVLCQDLAQNKMRSFATKLLTENRPSHTFFQSH